MPAVRPRGRTVRKIDDAVGGEPFPAGSTFTNGEPGSEPARPSHAVRATREGDGAKAVRRRAIIARPGRAEHRPRSQLPPARQRAATCPASNCPTGSDWWHLADGRPGRLRPRTGRRPPGRHLGSAPLLVLRASSSAMEAPGGLAPLEGQPGRNPNRRQARADGGVVDVLDGELVALDPAVAADAERDEVPDMGLSRWPSR